MSEAKDCPLVVRMRDLNLEALGEVPDDIHKPHTWTVGDGKTYSNTYYCSGYKND